MAKRRWLLLLAAAMIAASCESPGQGARHGVVTRRVHPKPSSPESAWVKSTGPSKYAFAEDVAANPNSWIEEWAGTYRAHTVAGGTLELGAQSYSFFRQGCLGAVEVYSGAVVHASAEGVRVEGDFGFSPDPLVRFDSQLYFVRWGERHYIIPRRSMARFGIAYQGRAEPDLGVESFLVKVGDESKPISEEPRMPKGFEHLLKFEYVRGQVMTLVGVKPVSDPLSPELCQVRFKIDVGRSSGVCVGMPLCVANHLGERNVPAAMVYQADDSSSLGVMITAAPDLKRPAVLTWGEPVWFGRPRSPGLNRGAITEAHRNSDDSVVEKMWNAEAEYRVRSNSILWQLDSRVSGDSWAREWAGVYSATPGAIGQTLMVGPHRDYAFRVHCCLPPSEINYGRILSVDAEGAAVLSLRIDSRDVLTLRFDDEVYFVRWGERHYAVPSRDMPRFCWEARRYQADPDRMFRVMLKQEDKKKPVAGLPVVPARFRRLLDPAPIEARIVAVKSGYAAESYQARSWTVTLDRGERAGLFKGMRLSVDGDEALMVTSTTADSAMARTEWLRSRVEWKPGDCLEWRE